MEYILTTDKLTKIYSGRRAADAVSLHIKKGDVYGLIGRNGAGKTTVLKMICGLSCPSSGSVTFLGKTGAELSGSMHKIGSLIETPGLFLKLTAYQNVKIKCILHGKNNGDYIMSLLKQVGLEHAAYKPVQNFSLGMKQRLGIAIALAGDPDFLVLDEPVNGLDPQGIVEMRELILKLNRERQITVLISSHILDELSRLATHYGIIDNGRMVKELSAEELDAACRKCVRMEVTDTAVLARVLDSMNLEYKIISATTADVYAKVNVTQLTVALAKENCEVLSMQEKDESLESYYISLVGGGNNA